MMSKQVALVTGGSRGIGLGIAKQLAGQGFDLAINGMRPEEQVKGVLDDLRDMGAEVLYVPGDIGDGAARQAMIDAVKARFGRLNWLVNNAGVAPRQRLERKKVLISLSGPTCAGPFSSVSLLPAGWSSRKGLNRLSREALSMSLPFQRRSSPSIAGSTALPRPA